MNGCQPKLGCRARKMRWAKTALTTKRSTTPAKTKTWAAMPIWRFRGLVAHTIRIIVVTILDMQKPNSMPEKRNLCPRFLLTCRMVMCDMAPRMKRKRKMAHIGTSRPTVGTPPRLALRGGYGGDCGCGGGLGPFGPVFWRTQCQLGLLSLREQSLRLTCLDWSIFVPIMSCQCYRLVNCIWVLVSEGVEEANSKRWNVGDLYKTASKKAIDDPTSSVSV